MHAQPLQPACNAACTRGCTAKDKHMLSQRALPAPAAAAGAPDGWGGGTYCIEVVVSVHTSCSRIISVMGRGCTACCVHGAGGKAGVEPIPKQIDSGRHRRPAVGRRARGGRSRWSRSTSPGAGRPGGCAAPRLPGQTSTARSNMCSRLSQCRATFNDVHPRLNVAVFIMFSGSPE